MKVDEGTVWAAYCECGKRADYIVRPSDVILPPADRCNTDGQFHIWPTLRSS